MSIEGNRPGAVDGRFRSRCPHTPSAKRTFFPFDERSRGLLACRFCELSRPGVTQPRLFRGGSVRKERRTSLQETSERRPRTFPDHLKSKT